ncbi:putrescine/spermidine ABC transporter ATP-binding protein, partial [Vibrio natriegens]
QEEALSMSDRIIVMRSGKVEQDGSPREIYEEPANLFVARFIGEINVFDAVVTERLDDKRIMANVEGRPALLHCDLPVMVGDSVKVLLRPEDIRLEEINNGDEAKGLIGYVRDRTYKGMTLESV